MSPIKNTDFICPLQNVFKYYALTDHDPGTKHGVCGANVTCRFNEVLGSMVRV
jgi:hypothetical protein